MKIQYYCRYSSFDNEHWYCHLKKGDKVIQIANYRLDMSPEVNARQIVDMIQNGRVVEYDALPDEMKTKFNTVLKKLKATVSDIEFVQPLF